MLECKSKSVLNMYNLIYYIIISAIVIFEILIKKYLSKKSFVYSNKKIYITKIKNTGFIYGKYKTHNHLAALLNCAAIIFVFILFLTYQDLSPNCLIGISLILGGGLSNTIDRIARGGVIDYIAIRTFSQKRTTVFNTADLCILSGAIMLFIYYIT